MTASTLLEQLKHNLQSVEERISAACRRAGQAHSEVTFVAVTKTVSPAVAALLPEFGVFHLGESRPQELWRKAAVLPYSVKWHLIGHLQRNKIAQTVLLVDLIHTVDSLRLLAALEKDAIERQRSISVLLEVNASREASKHGIAPDEVSSLVPAINALRWIHVRGLMTMAALEEPEKSRPTFVELRRLRDQLRPQLNPPHQLQELSMGMTNDFEIAIEEGATLVRIGTALFEGLTEVST